MLGWKLNHLEYLSFNSSDALALRSTLISVRLVWYGDYPSDLVLNSHLHRDYVAVLSFPWSKVETSEMCKIDTELHKCRGCSQVMNIHGIYDLA